MAAVAAEAALAKAAERAPEAESETWIRKGVELRRTGANSEALEAFLHAQGIRPSGRTVAQVGLARQSLHQWLQAAECLEQALASHEPWVEKNRAPLDVALAAVKAHLGWLLVRAPPGSSAWVNERPLPMKQIRLEEGHYVVRVEREGSNSWSDTVAITGGQISDVVPALEASRPVVVDVGSDQRTGLDAGETGRSRLGWTIGAGIVGTGLAISITGTVVWIQQARGSYGTFNSGSTGPGLLVGGLVGMLASSVLMYWTRERSVSLGMMGKGPALGGSF
jgi:hypothetical protein